MIPDPKATSASKKTSEQNNENSGEEVNTSGPVNHSGDECGNENRQNSVRGKKRPRQVSENAKRCHAKTRRGSSRGGGGGGHVEAVTLFEVVTMGRGAMEAVIDDWIEAYVTDRDSALLDLISFFIQCCGCKGVVTAEMCQCKDNADIMNKMVEEMDESAGLQYKRFMAFPWILTVTWPMDMDCVEYPLVQPAPYGRWFHLEFCDFLSALVSQCQHSVIFDMYLMGTLISLLAELSDSYIRAFRHTCTLAALKLLSSLAGVALSLCVGVDNTQRLYEVERSKTSAQQKTPRLERMRQKIEELQAKRSEIESLMDTIFKGVYLKRYRDALPDIRSMCVEELAGWMRLYSSAFLTDSYLKYIGWMMHDKIPDVRLKCVTGLQTLYRDPALLPKLDLFTSRFKERMISMTLDKDNEVALQALKLLVLISKSCDDILSPHDYKQLFQLVYSSQRPLAVTAGELLHSRLLSISDAEDKPQSEPSERNKHMEQTVSRLKALLQFHSESVLHMHVVYLVDSLWDCAGDLLKDWPMLTSILLQDTGLSRADQAVVAEMVLASVRQATEGPLLVGRNGGKKVLSAREKKTQMDDCSKLTEHFLPALPQLLAKFSGSWDVVSSLMKIPQYFLPECPAAENTQLVSELLAGMGTVVDLHSGPDILEAAARSYLCLCAEESTWRTLACVARDALIQGWADRLAVLLEDSLTDGSFSADQENTEEIVSTLRKLRAFHSGHDLSRWSLFELLSPLLSTGSNTQGGAPPQVTLEALRGLFCSVVWNLTSSGDTLTSREKAVAQRVQLSVFCERSCHHLSSPDHSVREQAFKGVCDVLTAHCFQHHVWDPTCYGPLPYSPSPKLQRALYAFIQEHVFVGPDGDGQTRGSEPWEEDKMADVHRRRSLLAAYCKLVVHGVLETSAAAGVFMYYVKYYNDFGDVIKETLSRTRQVDKMESARTLLLCLQQLFVRLRQEQERGGQGPRAHPGVQTFTSIKELARRFALTFGDPIKARQAVAMIHRSGIEFVFSGFVQTSDQTSPPLLSYLPILSEFSSKLLKPDKKTLYSYLQRNTVEYVVDLKEECWQPLVYYRASLLAAADGEDAVSYVSSDRRPYPASHRSPYSRANPSLDGNKSPCRFSPGESRTSRGQKVCFQEKPSDGEPVSRPVEPAARVLVSDGDEDSVDLEV